MPLMPLMPQPEDPGKSSYLAFVLEHRGAPQQKIPRSTCNGPVVEALRFLSLQSHDGLKEHFTYKNERCCSHKLLC